MFRPKVWGPVALVSGCAMGWQALDLIARRPDLRPWVIFLLALTLAGISATFYLVTSRLEQMARRDEFQPKNQAGVVAFDRSSPRIRQN